MAKNTKPTKPSNPNPLAGLNQPGQKAGQGKAKPASPAPKQQPVVKKPQASSKPITPPAPRPVKKTRPAAAVSQKVTVTAPAVQTPQVQPQLPLVTKKKSGGSGSKAQPINGASAKKTVSGKGLAWLWLIPIGIVAFGATWLITGIDWSEKKQPMTPPTTMSGDVVLPIDSATRTNETSTNIGVVKIPSNGGNAIGAINQGGSSNSICVVGRDMVVPYGTVNVGSFEKPKWPIGYEPTRRTWLDESLPDDLPLGKKITFDVVIYENEDVEFFWRRGWTIETVTHCPGEWYDSAVGSINTNDSRGLRYENSTHRRRNRYGVPITMTCTAWRVPITTH